MNTFKIGLVLFPSHSDIQLGRFKIVVTGLFEGSDEIVCGCEKYARERMPQIVMAVHWQPVIVAEQEVVF